MNLGLCRQAGRRGVAWCRFAIVGALVSAWVTGCEKTPPPPGAPAADQPATTRRASTQPATMRAATKPVASGEVVLTPAMKEAAAQPAGPHTGLFLDRREAGDVRVLNYNVDKDRVFPDTDQVRPEKFQRIVKALDPDIIVLQEVETHDAKGVVNLLNAIDPLPAGKTWYAYAGNTNAVVSKYPLRQTSASMSPTTYRDPAMALVDLPNDRYKADVYVVSNHFKCCDAEKNDPIRQKQADALIAWLRDARAPGDQIDLPAKTPIILAGDLNLVGAPQPLDTLIDGNVINEDVYGQDSPPDWDGTDFTDAHPMHNATGTDDYTWRNDTGKYKPGRLDYIIYSDSSLKAVHKFVLNTTTISEADLAKARLQKLDVTLDTSGLRFDHLPLVVDFRLSTP